MEIISNRLGYLTKHFKINKHFKKASVLHFNVNFASKYTTIIVREILYMYLNRMICSNFCSIYV